MEQLKMVIITRGLRVKDWAGFENTNTSLNPSHSHMEEQLLSRRMLVVD